MGHGEATVVLMGDGGLVPIGDVRVGDRVVSYDPRGGVSTVETVTATWTHLDAVVMLSLGDGTRVETTVSHPWWVESERAYVRTDHLRPGDLLRTADGDTLTVAGVSGPQGEQQVFNLTVTGPHTYHVGDTSLLVHNTCGPDLDALSGSGARPAGADGLTAAGKESAKPSGQGTFPVASGSPAAISQRAQGQLDDILTSAGTRTAPITGGRFAGGSYYIAPDGRGAAFDASGVFRCFGVFT